MDFGAEVRASDVHEGGGVGDLREESDRDLTADCEGAGAAIGVACCVKEGGGDVACFRMIGVADTHGSGGVVVEVGGSAMTLLS